VKRASAFLSLGGVDLFFYETPLGGKDNLPSSVISIVHQHDASAFGDTVSTKNEWSVFMD